MKINRRRFVSGIGSMTAVEFGTETAFSQGRGERNPPQPSRLSEPNEEANTRNSAQDLSHTERSGEPRSAGSPYEGPDPLKEWLDRHQFIEKRNPAIPDGFSPIKGLHGEQVFCSRLGTNNSGVRCYGLGEPEGASKKIADSLAAKAAKGLSSKAVGALAEAVVQGAGKVASKLGGAVFGLAFGPEANPPNRAEIFAVPDPRSYEQKPDFVGPKIIP